jgi:hypothetical protein
MLASASASRSNIGFGYRREPEPLLVAATGKALNMNSALAALQVLGNFIPGKIENKFTGFFSELGHRLI